MSATILVPAKNSDEKKYLTGFINMKTGAFVALIAGLLLPVFVEAAPAQNKTTVRKPTVKSNSRVVNRRNVTTNRSRTTTSRARQAPRGRAVVPATTATQQKNQTKTVRTNKVVNTTNNRTIMVRRRPVRKTGVAAQPKQPEKYFYATGAIGNTLIAVNSGESGSGSLGYLLGIGYQFNRYVGVQVAYQHLATLTSKYTSQIGGDHIATEDDDANAIELTTRLQWPITNNLGVYGLLGYASINRAIKRDNPSASFSLKDNVPVFGVGIRSSIWNARVLPYLEYKLYSSVKGKDATATLDGVHSVNFSTIMAGADIRF